MNDATTSSVQGQSASSPAGTTPPVIVKQLPVEAIGEQFAPLRLAHPELEQALVESMTRYGQTSALVAFEDPTHGYQLLDGFKRLKAARRLKMATVQVRLLAVDAKGAKVALLRLNWSARSLSDLEEAWVVHALCRTDGLSQVEVGRQLGRHKSWVCRRLQLIERLTDEVQEQLRLGLVGCTVARELARLPRDNQEAVLNSIRTHDLGSREVARLVDIFNGASGEQRDWLLSHPHEALANAKAGADQGKSSAAPEPRRDPRLSEEIHKLVVHLKRFHGQCESMSHHLRQEEPLALTDSERPVVLRRLQASHVSLQLLVHVLESTLASFSDDL